MTVILLNEFQGFKKVTHPTISKMAETIHRTYW